MQQTTKYKLNLVETSDAFSPAPLNENAQKTEALLQALETGKADAADTAALEGRVTALEVRRIVMGTYAGDTSSERTFELGFTPEAVMVSARAPHTTR